MVIMRSIRKIGFILYTPETVADEDAGRTPGRIRRAARNLFQRRRRRAGRGVNPTARLRDIIRSGGR
jgi:hypothetical protein